MPCNIITPVTFLPICLGSRFLEVLAACQANLAGIQNCPGVTPHPVGAVYHGSSIRRFGNRALGAGPWRRGPPPSEADLAWADAWQALGDDLFLAGLTVDACRCSRG